MMISPKPIDASAIIKKKNKALQEAIDTLEAFFSVASVENKTDIIIPSKGQFHPIKIIVTKGQFVNGQKCLSSLRAAKETK